MEKYKYYATWNNDRSPKLQSNGEGILRDINTYKSLNKLWKLSSNYTAAQARILIKNNDPKVKLVFDRKKGIKKETIENKIKTVYNKYGNYGDYLVYIYSKGKEFIYNKYEDCIREHLAQGLDSVQKYNFDYITNATIRVYEISSRSNYMKEKGRVIYEEIL